ncbi:hypothetical protein DFR86_02075 [Acidianus sulfidivorans JP7]|uniref:Uncharacterized protein n=1 Tax=Acidianus sulfidivorans JP7 TaxID=619593 RepID=A0A2U9IKE5_9CREN|nr:hypothetical protein [Acidianus sulfidivorans]AWR96455.1 hypothetical protein DFR86_02075 [Acidianus sulfidivorans JP7]
MSEEYFLKYSGDEIFVILLGQAGDKTYFYYPKGDVIVIVKNSGEISIKEIKEIYGTTPAGMKLSEPSESWEAIKNREVIWYVNGKEIHSDNLYVVLPNEKSYARVENISPNRFKYYVFKDQNPWDYEKWCCVLIASTKDLDKIPSTFQKVMLD